EPAHEYQGRLARWRETGDRLEAFSRRLGNARLAVGAAGIVVAAAALGGEWISAWWLTVPIAIFVVLAVRHAQADAQSQRANRGSAHYERAIARLQGRWIGAGRQGEQFRNPDHLYADDLDLFGKGSLFELISTARTLLGERVLADWFLTPGEVHAVRAR